MTATITTSSEPLADTRADLHSHDVEKSGSREGIAIIGFSFNFPQGADSVEPFWKMLMEGRNSSTEFPSSRLQADAFSRSSGRQFDRFTASRACFLQDNIAAFDAPFFSISAEEAQTMDPQQRALLETTYRAFENSGLSMDKVSGSKTSVYVGNFTDDYKMMYCKDPEQPFQYGATGVLMSVLSSRLSWFYNLTGQSLSLDSACSSSLTAIDIACQNLLSGESDMSIVGASNLIFSPDMMLLLSSFNVLSPEGQSFVFDHRANGYTRGEGNAVLVLKRVSDALDDGDCIRAVIRSSGSNQDGHTPNGMPQPSRVAQEALIRQTYQKAGLKLNQTIFVEAHGTGTKVGDAVEVNALGNAFKRTRNPGEYLHIGALKSNIGHLEGCSGLAGLIKTILILEQGIIPPNANFERANIRIDEEFLKVKFPVCPTDWPTLGLRRASVNSFGIGGSNCHVVLDDAYNYMQHRGLVGRHNSKILVNASSKDRGHVIGEEKVKHKNHDTNGTEYPLLLVWSSADERGMTRWENLYKEFFAKRAADSSSWDQSYYQSLAFTLASRRSMLSWKSYAIVGPATTLSSIHTLLSKPRLAISTSPKLGFIFTGQGAQWPRMALELLVYPQFRESLRGSENHLRSLDCRWSLIDELAKFEKDSKIHFSEYSQPICTAIQLGIVQLLRSFGINPSVVVGHSSGEIAAAYCAGAISSQSALKIAYLRGVYTSALSRAPHIPGAMLAVSLSQERISYLIDQVTETFEKRGLWIACFNSKMSLTISGDREQIDALELLLEKAGERKQRLRVNIAYHSPHMEPAMGVYEESIGSIEPNLHPPTQVPTMVSSVTGHVVYPEALQTSKYWAQNLILPVKFQEAISPLCLTSVDQTRISLDLSHRKALSVDILIEVGPHSALRGPLRDIFEAHARQSRTTYLSAMMRNVSATETLLGVAGQLHCWGYPISFSAINYHEKAVNTLQILTDLPAYPFDHATSYWLESRLSNGLRFAAHSNNEFLGKPVPDWNPLDARWRNFISAAAMPWVMDHQIQNQCLYPAAGMLVMALEAVKQIINEHRTIHGYLMESVAFHTPLIIPATGSIETQISLRPEDSKRSLNAQTCLFEFKIYSFQLSSTIEHCCGYVGVEYEKDPNEVDCGRNYPEDALYCQAIQKSAEQACTNSIGAEMLYQSLQAVGYGYGSRFQKLDTVSYGGQASTAHVKAFPDNDGSLDSISLHPATLDAFMQVLLVSKISECGDAIGISSALSLRVPILVEHLWVSNTAMDSEKTCTANGSQNRFKVSASLTSSGISCSQGNVIVPNPNTGQVFVKIEGLKVKQIPRTTNLPESKTLEGSTTSMCRRIDWMPDITLLSNEELYDYCKEMQTLTPDPIEKFGQLDCFLYLAISRTFGLLEKINTLPNEIISKYAVWIYEQYKLYEGNLAPNFKEEWRNLRGNIEYFDNLSNEIQKSSSLGGLCVRIWNNMPQLLRGEIDPLSLLFEDELLSGTYQELNEISNWLPSLGNITSHIAHIKGNMKVLEIGAGTGATTRALVEVLLASDKSRMRCARYDFTDISSGFFEKAREIFKDFRHLNFLTLDIEKNPGDQGFELGSYDLVVASLVLHATRDLDITLKHVRSLLRPGGKLILLEFVNPKLARFPFSMGLLPGWWLGSEQFRQSGPLVNASRWNSILANTGFSGNDIELTDFESDSCKQMSLILSTAKDTTSRIPNGSTRQDIILIAPKLEAAQSDISRIRLHLELMEFKTIHEMTLEEAASSNIQSGVFIFMTELYLPLLRNISAEAFISLQRLLHTAKAIMWLTRGGGLKTHPDFFMVDGLSRVFRNENRRIPFVVVAFEMSTFLNVYQVEKLGTILENTLSDVDFERCETEFIESAGRLKVGRVVLTTDITRTESPASFQSMTKPQKFSTGDLRVLVLGEVGSFDSFYFQLQERPQEMAPAEVEIKNLAVGINTINILAATGRLDQGSLGNECAGIVTRVGEGCEHLRPGDQVFGWGVDVFRSHVYLNHKCVAKIPDKFSIPEAACLPFSFLTAYYILDLVRARRGESILIHSAAGAIGQATIQVSRILGISNIFATVSSAKKKALLVDRYGIPESHIFFSRDTGFVQSVKRLQPAGVDIVLNSLNGHGKVTSWRCVAAYGRLIELGGIDADPNSSSSHPTLNPTPNLSIFNIDMTKLISERRDLLSEHFQTVVKLLEEEQLRNIAPLTTYAVDTVAEAFAHVQSGKSRGKVSVILDNEVVVPTKINVQPRRRLQFEKDKTYLVSGGLGGIGQMVARWMVARGARYLILLSRSGPAGHEVANFIEGLENDGAIVKTPSCNISDAIALKSLLEQYSTELPPIKGCVQASMVLDDSLFNNMTFSSWSSATAPKVEGSWNLHTLLPKDLDFFVLLSSVCGILGQVGQANYASGNTFEDALARFRTAVGYRNSWAIDLGIVGDAGYLARNPEITARLIASGQYTKISKVHLHALLDSCCCIYVDSEDDSISRDRLATESSQVIVGLAYPRNNDKKNGAQPPLFSHACQEGDLPVRNMPKTQAPELADLKSRFCTASRSDAALVVAHALRAKLIQFLSNPSSDLPSHDIDIFQPLLNYGVDSLLGVELRNWIGREFEADVAVFEIVGGASSVGIGNSVVKSSRFYEPGA